MVFSCAWIYFVLPAFFNYPVCSTLKLHIWPDPSLPSSFLQKLWENTNFSSQLYFPVLTIKLDRVDPLLRDLHLVISTVWQILLFDNPSVCIVFTCLTYCEIPKSFWIKNVQYLNFNRLVMWVLRRLIQWVDLIIHDTVCRTTPPTAGLLNK